MLCCDIGVVEFSCCSVGGVGYCWGGSGDSGVELLSTTPLADSGNCAI